jgi:hypothetical protein
MRLFTICLPKIRISNSFTPLTVPQLSTPRIAKQGVWCDLEAVPHTCNAITVYSMSILVLSFHFLHCLPRECLCPPNFHTPSSTELHLNFGKGVLFNAGIINPVGVFVSQHPVWLITFNMSTVHSPNQALYHVCYTTTTDAIQFI